MLSPCFIPEAVFFTQFVMLSPCFIPESVFHTQSVVRSPQSMFYTGQFQHGVGLNRTLSFGPTNYEPRLHLSE